MAVCPRSEVLAAFAAGDLSTAERGEVLDHAAGCAACHAAIALGSSGARTVPDLGVAATASPGDVATAETVASGSPVPALAEPTVGARLGRYEITRVLGRGAMGVVYAARDHELDREIALKLIRPQMSPERLRREAQALARLAHPNVVRVYDVGEDADRVFVAMELVDGENLRQWLATPRDREAILRVLEQAGHGLAAAHAAGLVHRDFKPDNVLIARDGQVLVGDFGLARAADAGGARDPAVADSAGRLLSSDSLTQTGALVGTPAYMAPEQVAGHAAAAADQYAFCVTAWEALFGRRPFAGTTLAEVIANAGAGRFVRPDDRDVPRRVEHALRRGLAAQAAARYPTMTALLDELAPVPRARRGRALAVGVAAVAVAGAATAAWSLGRTAPRVRCEDAARLIAPAWDAATADAITAQFGREVADSFAGYAATWQAARVEACRATHERHEQSPAQFAARVACLDRARDGLHAAVAAALASKAGELVRPDAIAGQLLAVERCANPGAQPPPPLPAVAAAVAALDLELAQVEVRLSAGTASISVAEATALRARAEAIGYPPQVARARLVVGRIAAWVGDLVTAEAEIRAVMLDAERAGDDYLRAQAGAHLAIALAEARPDDAARALDAARAALTRAGTDPSIDLSLTVAAARVAFARGDPRAAAAQQEQVIAQLLARSSGSSLEVADAYSRLVGYYTAIPDLAKAQAASEHLLAILADFNKAIGATELAANSTLDPMAIWASGDRDGAVRAAHLQIAEARRFDPVPHGIVAFALSNLALIYEADYDYPACLATHREAEAEWSLGPEAYVQSGAEGSSEKVVNHRIEEVIGEAVCLGGLERYAEQVATLRRARELAVAGGQTTAAALPQIDRNLGGALVDAGDPHAGRRLLEPIVAGLADAAEIGPLVKARLRFALARALWLDGGLADRPRALALVADADRDLDAALERARTLPVLRKAPVKIAEIRARIAAWRSTHTLR